MEVEASTGVMEKVGKQEVGISLYVGILVAVCVGVHIPDMEMPNIKISMPDFGFAVPEFPEIGLPELPDIAAKMPEMPAMPSLPEIPSMPEMPSLNPAELVQEGYNKAIEGVHEMKDSIVETLETVGQVVLEPLEKAWISEESPEVESIGETESTETVADAIEEVKNIEETIVAVESNIENETLSEATKDEEIVTDMEAKHEDNIDTDNSEDMSEELGNIEPNDSAVESTIAEVTETVVDTIEDVGSIEEPIVTAESAIEEPIVNAESANEEPIVNAESANEEPIVISESANEEPIVNTESANEEPIVTAESAIEELTFTEATQEEIIVDALEPEANEESLNSDIDKSADKSEHLTEDESLEVVLVDEVDDTNIVGENSVEIEQEGDMKTEESVGTPVDIITEDEAVPLEEKEKDIEEIKENSESKEESIVSSESKDTSENSLEVNPSLEIKSGG